MFFKVTLGNAESIIVGAENNKHLQISILHSDNFPIPIVEGSAYVFEEKQFKEFRSWDVGQLNIGDQLVIEVLESGMASQPSSIEFSMDYRKDIQKGQKLISKIR